MGFKPVLGLMVTMAAGLGAIPPQVLPTGKPQPRKSSKRTRCGMRRTDVTLLI